MESSSDSSFARTEGQLNQVQNEILQQGKDIEKFIEEHNRNHKPSSVFKTLETLFQLFKSELSMNLALRRGLLQAKERNEALTEQVAKQTAEIESFLAIFRANVNGDVDGLAAAGEHIAGMKEMQVENEKLQAVNRRYTRLRATHARLKAEKAGLAEELETLREHQAQVARGKAAGHKRLKQSNLTLKNQVAELNQALEKANSEIETINQLRREDCAHFALELANITAKVDVAEQQKEKFRRETDSLTTALEASRCEVKQLREKDKEFNDLQMKLAKSNDECFQLHQESQKMQMRLQHTEQRNQILQSEVDALQQHATYMMNDRSQFSVNLLRENDDLKRQLKMATDELDRARTQRESMQASKQPEPTQNEVSQKQSSPDLHAKLEKLRSQRDSARSELQAQKETAFKRIEELRTKIRELEDTHQSLLGDLQTQTKERQKQDTSKLKSLEQQLDSVRTKYTSLSMENKQLCNQLRVTSHDIQRLEAENAKLLTVIDKLKREMHTTRSIAHTSSDEAFSFTHTESPIRPTFSTGYNYDDSTTSSESDSIRPLMLAAIACNRLSKQAAQSLCSSAMDTTLNPHSVDIRGEIQSLQREIDSLKQEMCA